MKWFIWKSFALWPGKWVASYVHPSYRGSDAFDTWQAAMDYVIKEAT